MVRICSLAMFVLASFNPAAGQLVTVDGSHLMKYCGALDVRKQVEDRANKSGYCLGYLRAIANMQKVACIGPSADMDQIAAVFIRYMRNYPERWHLPAHSLAEEAFAQAYSCQPRQH